MLLRYDKKHTTIVHIDDEEVQELIPSTEEQVEICNLSAKLKDLDSITK